MQGKINVLQSLSLGGIICSYTGTSIDVEQNEDFVISTDTGIINVYVANISGGIALRLRSMPSATPNYIDVSGVNFISK